MDRHLAVGHRAARPLPLDARTKGRRPRAHPDARARERGGGVRLGLDVSELARTLGARAGAPGMKLRDAATLFVEIASTRCTARLTALEFESTEDGGHVKLQARFGTGDGLLRRRTRPGSG